MSPAKVRRGATLVELMAALSLAGVALLGAHMLLTALSDSRAALAHAAVANNASGTGYERLRTSVLMAEALEAGADRFSGDDRGAAFSARCPVAGGWLERCRIEIQLSVRGDTTALEYRENSDGWEAALTLHGTAHLIYQEAHSDSLSWRPNWGTSIARPSGIALVSGRDTLGLGGSLR